MCLVLHQDTDKQKKDNPNNDKVPLNSHCDILQHHQNSAQTQHYRDMPSQTPPRHTRAKSIETLQGLHEDITETPPRHEFTSDAPPMHHQDDIQQLTHDRDTDTILRRARHLTRSCAEILYTGLAPPCCKERSRGP